VLLPVRHATSNPRWRSSAAVRPLSLPRSRTLVQRPPGLRVALVTNGGVPIADSVSPPRRQEVQPFSKCCAPSNRQLPRRTVFDFQRFQLCRHNLPGKRSKSHVNGLCCEFKYTDGDPGVLGYSRTRALA